MFVRISFGALIETIFPDSTVIAVCNFILGDSKNTVHKQEVPIMKIT